MNLFNRLNNYLIQHTKVKLKDKADFFGLFATLQSAGISTIKALDILSRASQNPKLKLIIAQTKDDVQKGQNLSQSLQKHPDVFNKTEIGVIIAGESIGQLDKMLLKLKQKLKRDLILQKEVKSATTYPIVVLLILALAGVIMFGFVIPQLASMFAENDIQLPRLTRILMGVSDFLVAQWSIVLASLVLVGLLVQSYFDSPNGRIKKDYLLLKTPILGKFLRLYYQIRFFDTLGNLTEAGVPLEKAFDIISEVVDNKIYQMQIVATQAEVKKGNSISESLLSAQFLFEETASEMLAVGEKTANISEMSQEVAQTQTHELSYRLQNLTTIIGPVVIVAVGVMVAIFALAILSPVFSLSQGVV